MPEQKKKTEERTVYGLKEVEVRLKLSEGRTLYSPDPIADPSSAVRAVADALREMDREYFCVINLDVRMRPLSLKPQNFNIVSIGGINLCPVPVQNVFKAAMLQNSFAILLVHNHPSGDISPSREDIEVTKKLVEAGSLLDIPVTDHIIVAGQTGNWYSFYENQPELFGEAAREIHAVSEGKGKRSVLKDLMKKRERITERIENQGREQMRSADRKARKTEQSR